MEVKKENVLQGSLQRPWERRDLKRTEEAEVEKQWDKRQGCQDMNTFAILKGHSGQNR